MGKDFNMKKKLKLVCVDCHFVETVQYNAGHKQCVLFNFRCPHCQGKMVILKKEHYNKHPNYKVEEARKIIENHGVREAWLGLEQVKEAYKRLELRQYFFQALKFNGMPMSCWQRGR